MACLVPDFEFVCGKDLEHDETYWTPAHALRKLMEAMGNAEF